MWSVFQLFSTTEMKEQSFFVASKSTFSRQQKNVKYTSVYGLKCRKKCVLCAFILLPDSQKCFKSNRENAMSTKPLYSRKTCNMFKPQK